mmetsp:Transcript_18498/g.46919  ORF Transcript_18498/g.46919 Transcript_18498/m.46919 type:complete len:206 (-) Transcript_18498:101-718(-)
MVTREVLEDLVLERVTELPPGEDLRIRAYNLVLGIHHFTLKKVVHRHDALRPASGRGGAEVVHALVVLRGMFKHIHQSFVHHLALQCAGFADAVASAGFEDGGFQPVPRENPLDHLGDEMARLNGGEMHTAHEPYPYEQVRQADGLILREPGGGGGALNLAEGSELDGERGLLGGKLDDAEHQELLHHLLREQALDTINVSRHRF